MNERHQGRRKWNDTLSELGLEGESSSSPSPSSTPLRDAPQSKEPAPIPPAPLEEEEMPAPRHRRGRGDHAPIEERTEPVEPAPVEVPGESVETEGLESAPVEGAEGEKGGRKRRRRRGRRGGRGDRPEETTAAPDKTAPADVEAPLTESISTGEVTEKGFERPERSRGRDRGRRKREDVEELEVESDEEDEAVEVVSREEVAAAEDEPEDMSAWNVPSWQEIIASLYRPDR